MNDHERALIRMSSADTIHAWIFQPAAERSPDIRQYCMISSPECQRKAEIAPYPKTDYPEREMPCFVEVINIDALQATHETPSVPHEIHAYAKQCLKRILFPYTSSYWNASDIKTFFR